MQCPKCGFVMSELDPDCLRCKRMGDGAVAVPSVTAPAPAAPATAVLAVPVEGNEEKECPRCGKATDISAALCDKCGYEYQAEASRAERYQALLAQETIAAPPSALRREVPQSLSWGIIAACLLVIGGAGWGMFGGSLTGTDSEDNMNSPILTSHHHKSHHPLPSQMVTYTVTGTSGQAFVAYLDANAVSVAPTAAVALPWTQTFKAKTGAHLSLSALPASQGGTVAVSIQVDGAMRKQASMPGANGQTLVEDTL